MRKILASHNGSQWFSVGKEAGDRVVSPRFIRSSFWSWQPIVVLKGSQTDTEAISGVQEESRMSESKSAHTHTHRLWTTGFSHCFHLPGCHFGYLFPTHSHLTDTHPSMPFFFFSQAGENLNLVEQRDEKWRPVSPSRSPSVEKRPAARDTARHVSARRKTL